MDPPWNSMEFHGPSMELHGVPWTSIDLPWKPHGTPWSSMELHGLPWNSMELHGVPWNSMDFHGVILHGGANYFFTFGQIPKLYHFDTKDHKNITDNYSKFFFLYLVDLAFFSHIIKVSS